MLNFELTEYAIKKGFRITEIVGDIIFFASKEKPESLSDQFNRNYSHGGGWMPLEGFTMDSNKVITYPDDPPLYPLAIAKFREQEVVMYAYAWVAIVEKDGSFEISRMD